MKVLVTGVNGQLGYDVVKRLYKCGIECKGVCRADFDITDQDQTMNFITLYDPDAVIHCAAYTAVDKAEDEKELCYVINVDGTRNVAMACTEIGAKLMYISTDYVFDGKGTEPFEVDSPKAPLNYYGLTKSLGEDEVIKLADKFFIVRISWVFGINGNNFVKTMLHLGANRNEINVVCDQVGSPTYTFDLARLLCDMIIMDKYGIYHATNEGYCSWAEFAKRIFKQAGNEVKINEILTSEYPTRAIRPYNSRLSKKSLDDAGFKRLPQWRDALIRYIKEVK